MPGQIPTSASFPSSLTLCVVPSPSPHPPANILILLHSIGDTHTPFTTLASRIALPETLCITLRGSTPMPFDFPGFHYGTDIHFASGQLTLDAPFDTAGTAAIASIFESLEKLDWTPREIHFFGFGQGGMCVLDYLARNAGVDYGSAVSIGGILGSETPRVEKDGQKVKTALLVCGGSRGSVVTREAEDKLKKEFESVEVVRWRREGDGMMSNREEMLGIMEFWSRRLLSRRGVPKGFEEVR